MKNREEFDERQLKIRGDVFQHSFVLLVILLLVNAFLDGNGIAWAEGMWPSILIVMTGVAMCSLEQILRGVYVQMGRRKGTILMLVMSGAAIFLLVVAIIHLAGGEALILGDGLTANGGSLVIDIYLLVISGSYWAKRLYEKYHKEE